MEYIVVHPCNIARCGSLSKAIAKGYFEKWNREKIKFAFAFGNGTIKDFIRYVKNNNYIFIKEILIDDFATINRQI